MSETPTQPRTHNSSHPAPTTSPLIHPSQNSLPYSQTTSSRHPEQQAPSRSVAFSSDPARNSPTHYALNQTGVAHFQLRSTGTVQVLGIGCEDERDLGGVVCTLVFRAPERPLGADIFEGGVEEVAVCEEAGEDGGGGLGAKDGGLGVWSAKRRRERNGGSRLEVSGGVVVLQRD